MNYKTYRIGNHGFMLEDPSGKFIHKDDPALVIMEQENKNLHGYILELKARIDRLEDDVRGLNATVEEKDEEINRLKHEGCEEAEEKGCMFEYIQDLEEEAKKAETRVSVVKYLISEHDLMKKTEECAKLRTENYNLKLKVFTLGGGL